VNLIPFPNDGCLLTTSPLAETFKSPIHGMISKAVEISWVNVISTYNPPKPTSCVCARKERSCPPYLTIHFGRVGGVVLSKVIAVLLMLGVRRRLWMVNLVYIGVICWNVVVVVALAVHRH
jgi:hypothetical protein